MGAQVVKGFTTTTTTTTRISRTLPTISKRSMMTPDQVHDVVLLHSTNTIPTVLSQSTTQWLADAAPAAQDEGWWSSYINIFKTALLFVHSTIDGPLRSLGIEQTWGISIAVFTACTYRAVFPPW
jgi:YidC/Oxa1 family membrane protein insertase